MNFINLQGPLECGLLEKTIPRLQNPLQKLQCACAETKAARHAERREREQPTLMTTVVTSVTGHLNQTSEKEINYRAS